MINDELRDLSRVRDDIKRYVKAQLEQILYKVAIASTKLLSSVAYLCVAVLLALCVILFFGVMLGFGFAKWFDVEVWIGFSIVLGLYLFGLLFILAFKKTVNRGLSDIIASRIIDLIDDELYEPKEEKPKAEMPLTSNNTDV